MDNRFINHNDPTASIDLSKITIEEQYTKLTDREKILVGAKMLGMNHVPVDIRTFLSDPYYLGDSRITNYGKSVFSYWKQRLPEIFPTPITTSTPYISFGGCIGSGKSSASRFMGLYQFHRLDCCENIYKSLGQAGGTKLGMAFFHASAETAFTDFVQYFKTVFSISPYFQNQYNNPPIRLISSGPRSSGSVIGVNLIYTVLSELGFWRSQDAVSKINEVLIRYQSRFVDKRFNFGGIVCDSSAKDAEQGASQLFEESVPEQELYTIHPSHWQVRPELYRESKGETFTVYRGDSKQMPRILEDGEDITTLDKDRIIKVPIQLKFNFLNDIVRSIQDLAGYPLSLKDLFFNGDISRIIKASTIKNIIQEVIEVDFYDINDTIYDQVYPMIDRIPLGTTIFLHLDLGLKDDITGLAITYFSGEIVDIKGFDKTSYPTFKVPLILGISRKKGQSTSIDHIFQFIKKLSGDFNVIVSADSFASAGLFQQLQRAGIENKLLSVDRSTDAYFYFKNTVLAGRVTFPYHSRFLRECSELRVTQSGTRGEHVKIDHPAVSSCHDFDYKFTSGDQPGTKDVADAVVGSIYSCYLKYAEYGESGGGASKQLQILDKITTSSHEETQQVFQDMLENIFD